MPGVVISNTSPLQYLHQAGLLDLLPRLFGRVIVPQAVVLDKLQELGFYLSAHARSAALRQAGEAE